MILSMSSPLIFTPQSPLQRSSSFPTTATATMTLPSTFSHHLKRFNNNAAPSLFSFRLSASSSSFGTAEFTEEPATKVKFQKTLSLPGCSTALTLLGTAMQPSTIEEDVGQGYNEIHRFSIDA